MAVFDGVIPAIIGAANAASGFEIERSLRFNSADSAYLNRTPSSEGNPRTWTWSAWLKKAADAGSPDDALFTAGTAGTTQNRFIIKFSTGDQSLEIGQDNAGTFTLFRKTSQVFRDYSSWGHLVVVFDSTESTANDRLKIYWNGSQITDFATNNTITQYSDTFVNKTGAHYICDDVGNYHGNLDAYLAEVNFVDGQALAASDFGEYDDNNVWQPKTFEGSYGVDGYTVSGGAYYAASTTWAHALNGSTTGRVMTYTTTSTTATFSPGISWSNQVRIYGIQYGGGYCNVNGGSALTGFSTTAGWVDVTTQVGSSGTLTSLTVGDVGSNYFALYAIELDGTILDVPQTGVNGFHLDFSDNSSNAALGTDSSGNSNDWTVNNLVAESPTTLPAVAFDGNDHLSLAYSSDFVLDGDFTIEYFVYWQSGSVMLDFTKSSGYTEGYQLYNQTPTFAGYSSTGNASMTSSTALPNGWNHVAVTRTVSNNTARMFINGVQTASSTSFSHTYGSDTSNVLSVGAQSFSGPAAYFTGKISNLRILNGTALYTANFTVPTTPLTNVTDTVLLCCQSSTSTTTAAVAPGTITANGDPTAVSFSDSTAADDSLIDTPTNYEADSGNNGGNYCTLNPFDKNASVTVSNGNLDFNSGASPNLGIRSTFFITSGKYYWEITNVSGGGNFTAGIAKQEWPLSYVGVSDSFGYGSQGIAYPSLSGGTPTYTSANTAGDIVGFAFDADLLSLEVYVNGTSLGFAAGWAIPPGNSWSPAFATGANVSNSLNFGQRPFAYTPPTGYVSLCTQNLPDPTIADGSTAFDAVLYTGDGNSTQTITGLNFAPDLTWQKIRNTAGAHGLTDSVRGVSAGYLRSDSTNVETGSATNGVSAFTSDGFTAAGAFNTSSNNWVTWTWDAGTSTVSNTDGSITSNVRANQSAGFSIVSYTGSGTSPSTIGHGLNAVPEMILVKNRSDSWNWAVYHKGLIDGSTVRYLILNSTSGQVTGSGHWQNTVPSSSVFTVGNDDQVNASVGTDTYIAYCFAPVEGFSAFGTYTGNGSVDGPYVYTGFKPKFILLKRYDASGNSWNIFDTARSSYNVVTATLFPDSDTAEASSVSMDILSNGFKFRTSSGGPNGSGMSYIYAAFAEHPFKTARAR